MYVGIVPNVAFAIWFNVIHTQTDFEVTKNWALRKRYCFNLCRKLMIVGLSLLFNIIFVCSVCLCDFVSKQQQISGKQNQTNASLNLSYRTFYMCPDRCTSILQLHRGPEASDGIFLHFINLTFQWEVTQLFACNFHLLCAIVAVV